MTEKKTHGMRGKRNAGKAEELKKSARIYIRCEPELKTTAEETAKKAGKTLSDWVTALIKKNLK